MCPPPHTHNTLLQPVEINSFSHGINLFNTSDSITSVHSHHSESLRSNEETISSNNCQKKFPKKRDETVDALKGFGILTVVAGHCVFPFILWINPYSFHMPLFFMISGFFLNFHNAPFDFIKTKFQRLMVPFFKYLLFFSIICWLLHFTNLPLTKNYTFSNTFGLFNFLIVPMLHNHNVYPILALWFVSTLFVAMVLVAFTRPYLLLCSKNVKYCVISMILLTVLISILSAFSVSMNKSPLLAYLYRLGVAWCFVCLGWLIWNNRKFTITPTVLLIFSVIFLSLAWKYGYGYVFVFSNFGETYQQKMLFSVFGITGFYFSILVTEILMKAEIVKRFLIYCGQKSFHIMGLHLTGFLILNLCLTLMPNMHLSQINDIYFRFPISTIWYFFSGLFFSIFCCYAYDNVVRKNGVASLISVRKLEN